MAGFILATLSACTDEPRAPAWRDQDDFAGVKTIAVGEDGTVYVGGNFTRLGPQTGGGVRVDATTGEPLAGFPVVDGSVDAAAPDGSGGWYIGGQFTRVSGQPRDNLAHVLADGSVDAVWTPAATFGRPRPDGARIYALARDGDVVYVSGAFSQLDDVPRLFLGAVDVAGKITDWAPTFDGISVFALASYQGTVYLGGDFREVNGEARMSLAAVDSSGALTPWNPGARNPPTSGNAYVSSLVISGDTLVLGGWFTDVGGQPRAALAAVDARSGTPTPWAPHLELTADPMGPWVGSLAVWSGALYAGGSFTEVDGQPRQGIVAFDATGRLSSWAPALDGRPVSRVCAGNGVVYVSGEFLNAEGRSRTRLAAFDVSGALADWDPDVDDQSSPDVIGADGDTVLIGGRLRWVGRRTRRAGLAAIDRAGRVMDWNPGVSGDMVPAERSGMNSGSVLALAVSGDTVYVGGTFTSVGGQPRSNLAAVSTAGTVSDWTPAPDGPVYALESSDRALTVGGRFSRMGNVERAFLAAFDPSGNLTPWAPAPNGYVTSFTRDGSTLYVGGYFTAIGQSARSMAAAFGTDGALLPWSPSITGTFASSRWSVASRSPGVSGLAASGGVVYLAGDFTQVGGEDRRGLAAVDSTGASTPFRLEVPSATDSPVFPPRALQWGVGKLLAGATVAPATGSSTLSTVVLADPGSPPQGPPPAVVAVDHDPYLSAGVVWQLQGGRPLTEAFAVRGDIVYVGGAFRGDETSPRWSLAALDRDGRLTAWNPNSAP
jgi:hypothetical protein